MSLEIQMSILAICVCTIALLVLLLLIGGNVYVNWYLQILDISFITNTGIFAAATLYLRCTGGSPSLHICGYCFSNICWNDYLPCDQTKLQRHQRLGVQFFLKILWHMGTLMLAHLIHVMLHLSTFTRHCLKILCQM